MSNRISTSTSRDTLRAYIGAFLASLKDCHAAPEDVRAVLGEYLGLELDEAQAWIVRWKGTDGLEWVQTHASELPAIDHARYMRGTVTALYGPTKANGETP